MRTSVLQVNSRQKASPVGLPPGALLIFGGLCLLMLGWGLWLAMSWMGELLFTRNPRFTLQKVETRTDGLLLDKHLQNWTEVEIGENLYAINLDEVRSRLESQPIIRRAVVQRKLPGTLSVGVNERVPIARTGQVDGGMNWLIDEEGVRIKKSFESKHLPLIVGIRPGEDISKSLAAPVLPYLVALRDMRSEIRELLPVYVVNVGYPDYLDFRLRDGFQIKFPREGNLDKLILEASRGVYEIRNQDLNKRSLDMCPSGPNKIAGSE